MNYLKFSLYGAKEFPLQLRHVSKTFNQLKCFLYLAQSLEKKNYQKRFHEENPQKKNELNAYLGWRLERSYCVAARPAITASHRHQCRRPTEKLI